MNDQFYVEIMQDLAEVTGNLILCVTKIGNKTIKFAIDCGLYQEYDYEKQNLFFITNPKEVEFVIITHNHTDHTGRLPYFVKSGFSGKIYMTSITQRILGKALNDSSRILEHTSKRKNIEALYDTDNVEKTLSQVEGCSYNELIRINENITLTFIPNGHIIGSAMVLLQIHGIDEDDNINLLFSGDYSNRNSFFRVAPIRKWIRQLPINVVIESTYGYMDSTEIKHVFKRNILRALKKRKTIVIPVFSLGRAQVILYLLKDLQKKYPERFENVPIYYDGKLSFFYTDMYYQLQKEGLIKFYKRKNDFLPDNLERVLEKKLRKKIISDNGCKIIVSSSGNGSYGPVQRYLYSFVGNENALIHFTGYCSENSLGYRLKNAENGSVVEVGGVKTIKRADIEFTNEFSDHAKADEIINKLLKKFDKPPLFIMVNHGRQNVKDILAERILKEVKTEYVGILGREYFYRIDKNGFVKGIVSKLL